MLPLKYSHLKIKITDQEYQYVLFDNYEDFKAIILKFISDEIDFFSFSLNRERSLICPADQSIPYLSRIQRSWIGFKIEGEMPFGTVEGLIATIANRLYEEGIGVCLVSTFKTDLFLIKKDNALKAKETLTKSGWDFV